MPVLGAPNLAPAFHFVRRVAIAALCASFACGLPVAPAAAEDAGTPLLKAPVVPVPPLFTPAAIDKATAALDGIVADVMKRTGMPGVAVGVVYKDKVIYAKGFGVREVGKPGAIDSDTVFLLASVSKPIASTIVAKLVGDGVVKWDDPAKLHNPAFALSDPYVTEHAMLADLLSHRSGLRTGSGRPARGSRLRPGLHPLPSRPAAARSIPRDLSLQQFRLYGRRHRRGGGGRQELGRPCRRRAVQAGQHDDGQLPPRGLSHQ